MNSLKKSYEKRLDIYKQQNIFNSVHKQKREITKEGLNTRYLIHLLTTCTGIFYIFEHNGRTSHLEHKLNQ